MIKLRAVVLRAVAAVLISASAIAAAPAADGLSGTSWLGDNGGTRIRFVPCGSALCGTISWLRDTSGKAKIGQRVFFDLKPSGENQWDGKAFDPDTGKNYTGSVQISGATLITKGCVLAGVMCETMNWARAN
ncbi:DUF2147 domain-containing protein [Bradyrhizobium sp. SZCCHNS1054]|uniref:DUF2147 domain-containing protein n=1 Tax=Bradyrhizobium sp. SZCCHNS1054 TaxID=3057301 RepID=UPI0029161018|nr:DUF2147 domain-containing protein [Bradyrhizobium sp. SZCCHNS1054]